jgi:hypothetical protein
VKFLDFFFLIKIILRLKQRSVEQEEDSKMKQEQYNAQKGMPLFKKN